ncbi:hypothetical protein D1007_14728 [Hordeum vulgare]|nr:hypothetical protein D1007_14728 [Hordeum vulgare]
MATRWLAVGYFFSVLPFSTVGLFGELKSKWGLRGRLSYTPLRNNRFMLEFEREEVNTMPIWARIYDVPPLMLSEEIGWKLGGLLGEVLRVDADKFGYGQRDCRFSVDDQTVRFTGSMRASPFKMSKNKGGFLASDACSARRFLHFGSEVHAEAWTAPAKMACESLGKEKEKEDTNCSQEMVRYMRVPDEVLLDPIVQAAIAAVSKLKVSDGPEHGDTRKLSIGENSMKPLENIPETVVSTPAVATATTRTSSTPPADAVIGNDIDTTPDAHTVLEAATPPFPPGFGPDVVFKASPNVVV